MSDVIQPMYPEQAEWYKPKPRVAAPHIAKTPVQIEREAREVRRLEAWNEAKELFDRWSAASFAGALVIEKTVTHKKTVVHRVSRFPEHDILDMMFGEKKVTRTVDHKVPDNAEMLPAPDRNTLKYRVRDGYGIPVPKLWVLDLSMAYHDGTEYAVHDNRVDKTGILTTGGRLISIEPDVQTHLGLMRIDVSTEPYAHPTERSFIVASPEDDRRQLYPDNNAMIALRSILEPR